MAPQYFVQGIFATAGLIALLASILNWNWFFTAQNAQLIVRNVGRGRARLFYGLLGVIMIGMLSSSSSIRNPYQSNWRDFISRYLLITSIDSLSGVVSSE